MNASILRAKPLDELEMFDLLRAAYPEKFTNETDKTYEEAQNFANELCGWEDVSELLGRIVMLTMPMESAITNIQRHVLGTVTYKDGRAILEGAVFRDIYIPIAGDNNEK